MLKLIKVWMALLTGELVVDMTVNTDKFPFHDIWNGIQSTLRLESRRLENGTTYRDLWTIKGNIPYHVSGWKLFKLVVALAFKGSVTDFYGGISMKLATPVRKNNVLNVILARFGYVTIKADEYKTLRDVMKMMKDKNDALKQQVASHEELLTSFSVQHRELSDEVQDVRGRLDQTQEQLGQTQEQLGQTQDRVAKLEAQSDALCAALGIQSVDEFLQSVLPKEPECADTDVHQTKLPGLE